MCMNINDHARREVSVQVHPLHSPHDNHRVNRPTHQLGGGRAEADKAEEEEGEAGGQPAGEDERLRRAHVAIVGGEALAPVVVSVAGWGRLYFRLEDKHHPPRISTVHSEPNPTYIAYMHAPVLVPLLQLGDHLLARTGQRRARLPPRGR